MAVDAPNRAPYAPHIAGVGPVGGGKMHTQFNRDGSRLVWTVITAAVVIVCALRIGGAL